MLTGAEQEKVEESLLCLTRSGLLKWEHEGDSAVATATFIIGEMNSNVTNIKTRADEVLTLSVLTDEDSAKIIVTDIGADLRSIVSPILGY